MNYNKNETLELLDRLTVTYESICCNLNNSNNSAPHAFDRQSYHTSVPRQAGKLSSTRPVCLTQAPRNDFVCPSFNITAFPVKFRHNSFSPSADSGTVSSFARFAAMVQTVKPDFFHIDFVRAMTTKNVFEGFFLNIGSTIKAVVQILFAYQAIFHGVKIYIQRW